MAAGATASANEAAANAAAALVAGGRAGIGAGLHPYLLARWLEAERPQWFLWLPVAVGLGIAAYFSLGAEPELLVSLLPLPLAVALWALARRGGIPAFLFGLAVAAAAGFALAKLRSDGIAAPVLERRIGPVEVRGRIELVELREMRGERLTLRVTAIEGLDAARTPARVRIRTMQASEGLGPGDAVRVRAHLAPPSGPALPGGYDFARGAWFQALGGIGYGITRAEPDPEARPDGGPSQGGLPRGGAWPAGPWSADAWRDAAARLRQDITRRITRVLDGQTGAIAAALISGERGGISEKTNDAFRDSGLYHMLSISGLHMAIMGGSVFYAVRLLLALFPPVALRYPVKKWAAAAAILASLGYLVISGAAFATVRSAVTITIMFLAILLDRPAIAMRNVALSALLILLVWPESLTDVGFQMSFAAVTALVASYEAARRALIGRARWPEGVPAKVALFVAGIVLSTLIASLAVAPFGAYYFHKGQQLAIVANVIATPICNLVIMPAALAALVAMPLGLEAAPLALMGIGIDATVRTAEWVAALPGAAVRIPAMPAAAFLSMVAGGIWLALWRERVRWLGLVPLAFGLALAPGAPRPDILAGRDGRLLAVRTPAGVLAADGARQSAFELARWLEHDGDGRRVAAAAAGEGFRCDARGCTARVKGLLVAHPRHPSAIADDCARADVLVLDVPRPRGCTGPRLVLDVFDFKARGTHAIVVDDGRAATGPAQSGVAPTIRVTSVAATRGERPWAPLPWWANGRRRAAAPEGAPADAATATTAWADAATDSAAPAPPREAAGRTEPSRMRAVGPSGDGGGTAERRSSGASETTVDATTQSAGTRWHPTDRTASTDRTVMWSRLPAFAAPRALIETQLTPSVAAASAAGIDEALADPSVYDERW